MKRTVPADFSHTAILETTGTEKVMSGASALHFLSLSSVRLPLDGALGDVAMAPLMRQRWRVTITPEES